MLTQTRGVFLISPQDADAIQALLSDPAIAATTRLPHPYPENGARDFIAAQEKERLEGTAYVYTIKDEKKLVGACGLHGIEGDHARELGFWIGHPYWGKGYATFGVKMVLQFAFKNLRLETVGSCALESNAASRRVLEKNGFRLLSVGPHQDRGLKRPDEHVAVYEITRAQWLDTINGPALSSLHPALRAILATELAAGNEIAETGGGWPDKDSIFVRLKHPFKTPHSPPPAGVIYTEPNDPHWWKADFSAGKPPHILAY
jgi:ribosomal-protein-alanine N-acetyltransferase